MKAKDKSIFYSTSYLRSLFGILGSCIAITIVLAYLIKQENHYPKVEGEIIESLFGRMTQTYFITLNTSNRDYIYITSSKKDFPILEEKAVIGKKAAIWFNMEGPHRSNRSKMSGRYIKKMIVDDEIIIPYKKKTGFYIFLLCMVCFILVVNIHYVIKHPAHLAGRRE